MQLWKFQNTLSLLKLKNGFGILLGLLLLITSEVSLAYGGGHSLGGHLIFTSPGQDDLDLLIERANEREGGISTRSFGQGYEFSFFYQYRFSGTMFAIQFRPSYFMQQSTGSGVSGSFDYKLSGFTFFPALRLYPLENSFLKFFMQVGVGYGRLSASVEEAGNSVDFSSGNFGAMGGLGAEFCFTDNHCMILEGNMRYLPFERNKATSFSGTFADDSIDNQGNKKEVEIDNEDLGTTMSGFQAVLGYSYTF